jgi:hypothetical protein
MNDVEAPALDARSLARGLVGVVPRAQPPHELSGLARSQSRDQIRIERRPGEAVDRAGEGAAEIRRDADP